MLYYGNRRDRKIPKSGDIIYLIPIRYWETRDYEPVKFKVENVDGKSLYGYSYEYGHNVYYPFCDIEWFYQKRHARSVQLLLAKIYNIVSKDDIVPIMKEICKLK